MSSDLFPRVPARAALLSAAINAALAVLIPVPAHADSPAEMQLRSAVNAAIDAARTNATQMTVQQQAARAITVWDKLNVRSGESLIIDQLGHRDWSMLARINDIAPSVFNGNVKADGSLYLINANGILFGKGAQVNVGSLVASTLDIKDELFLGGIPSNTDQAGMAAFSAFPGASDGLIKVEQGATLTAETGGRVMLLAQNVENHGLITTPEGQTILAAGDKVYLAVSDDPRLRGFLVEVDNGGSVTNKGVVIAERGNVSMTGLTVNQSGRVTATTSTTLNGSIRLMARDTVSPYQPPAEAGKDEPRPIPVGTRTGNLVFGEGSVTEVLPEVDATATLTDEQSFNRSSIQGVGRTIHVQRDSLIRAQSGEIALAAQAGQLFQVPGSAKEQGVRLQVDSGAVLDVSGLLDVPVSVERNYIQVELRGDQLKDSPLQRDTFLYKSKVWIDVEKGTPLADVKADIAKLARTVAEKSAKGGDIVLRSEGDMVLQAGSQVNVSGGSLAYQAGFGRTTKLLLNGKVVDIGQAYPEQVYDGFADQYTIVDPKWGVTRTYDLGRPIYIPGYTAGRDAGTVSLEAHGLVADATFLGKAVAGEYQRSQIPRSGLLKVVGLVNAGTAVDPLQNVSFVTARTGISPGFNDALPADLVLSTDFLDRGGFGRVAVYSEGRITLARDVALNTAPKGSVILSGHQLDIQGDISAPGGDITLTTRTTNSFTSTNPDDYLLRVGPDAHLSTRALWINDLPASGAAAGTGATIVNGGNITLTATANLDLQTGSVLDVGGGAWLKADGKTRFGNAGQIKLSSGRFGLLNASDAQVSSIRLNGELRAYALGDGGKLTLDASSIYLGAGGTGKPGELVLGEAFFQNGGFKNYDLSGVDGVTVADGFQLQPRPLSAVLGSDFRLHASGSDLSRFTTLQDLGADFRQPTSVGLHATSVFHGDLKVGENALLQVDPQGSIVLSATQQLTVLGTLAAPAGSITLSQSAPIPQPQGSDTFDAGRSIFLGEHSRLLATGYYRPELDPRGLRKGQVLDGGTVTIDAAKGYLIAQQGSLIDVSGAGATLDLVDASGLVAQAVGSNGGVIALSAREGMLLEGGLTGRGGNSQAMGGSLSLRLNRDQVEWNEVPLNGQRIVTLHSDPTSVTAGLVAGAALDTARFNGKARLAQTQVRAGGFSSLTLDSEHRIEFAETLNLNLNGRLGLYAPNLASSGASSANLNAASVILGNPTPYAQSEFLRNDASGGAGKLTLNAGLIELVGHTNMQGFGSVNLVSKGDIRFRSVVFDDPVTLDVDYANTGSLATGGNLNLAARQIYPTSMAEFALEVHNNPAGSITVTSTGADNPVLSAGGKLSLSAPFIEQSGTIKAPFGEISLKSETIDRVTTAFGANGLPKTFTLSRTSAAGGEVSLAAGSLTSVSAEGQTIPLGYTELSGRDWIYDLGLLKQVLTTPPEKRVVLDGEKVTMAAGSRLDLSGGGDMYAYEFLKGPGGSRDILLPGNSEGLYAVLPELGSAFAPFDSQTYQNLPDWNPGASVRLLDGALGLKAGNYALLPARYALLPGAYLVRVQQADSDQIQGLSQTMPNGAVRVAGYLGSATAGGDVLHGVRTSTIEVRPGSVARQYSEYLDTLASDKFADLAGAQQPGDAGRLSISVGKTLSLAGELRANYDSGRRGPEVDISALKLAVTADGGSYAADHVTLSASQLQSLGANSLLLGGTRSVDADGGQVRVEQRSEQVVIAGKTKLSAPELILAARDTVKLEKESEVAGQGEFSGQAKNIHVADAAGNGDGALLRVSTSEQVSLTRAPASLVGGVLDVAGATVDKNGVVVVPAAMVKGKSVILDATLDNRTLGTVKLPDSGGALTLGATRISLAENGTAVNSGGLVFDQKRLAALGNPAHLLLRSYSTLDVYGNVKLGGAGLASLGIEAAGIAGYGAGGQSAQLQADRIRFANPDGIKAATAFTGTTGQGALAVKALDVELGKGDFTLRGFQNTELTATGQVLGLGGSLKVEAGGGAAGHLTLNAGRITVAAGASQKILADGDLLTSRPEAPVDSGAAPMGGKLEMAGAKLTHGGRIAMPAGEVILRSTGAGDVILQSGSEIRAGGATVAFADTRAHASGGRVSLESSKGNVDIQTGAEIDVAGDMTKDTGGGDAGVLEVWAAGDATVKGTLLGDAASGYDSGRFQLEANHINKKVDGSNDFSALNSKLEAGGFHQSRQIRIRQGDIELAATDSVKAHEFLLSADQGKVSVAGTVDASGAKGGRIELYAGGNLDLLSSAKLLANANDSLAVAKGTTGEGGLVVLGSGDTGKLSMASGAQIKVSVPSGSAARAGRVMLRAIRTGSDAGNGVALGTLQGEIIGAERVDVEAYKVYAGSDGKGITELTTGTSSDSKLGLSTVQTENNTFVAAVDLATLKDKLNTGTASFNLLPGVEARNAMETDVVGDVIANSGDIKLSADWNLNPLRHNGQAGVLTLRAGGNLDLAANLSDGFSTATASGTLRSSPVSWSYRLVAGADTGAADPLATNRNVAKDTGNLSLATAKLVRTGGGDIQTAAASDVLLAGGAALYTAGYATPAVSGFLVKPNLSGNAFPTGGGDIRVRAGGSVVAQAGPSGLVTDWLYRQGRLLVSISDDLRTPGWWPQISQFKNGIGALGGGDVDIAAGDRAANLLAATVTNARQPASFGAPVDVSKQVVQGGGDLSVRVGGNVEGGVFFVDRGIARIAAGGTITSGSARTNQKVGTTLALGDASAAVTARLDLNLESVVNPTLIQQVDGNLAGGGGSSRETYFVSYGADSAARLLSVAGDAQLVNDTGALSTAYGVSVSLAAYPGTLEVVSLQGNVVTDHGFTLTPSAVGDLRLLAGDSVRSGGTVYLSDEALSKIPTLTAPRDAIADVTFTLPLHSGTEVHAAVPLHQADSRPVYVVAREGDIAGPTQGIFAVLAKSAMFHAGRDISNVTVYGQNLRDSGMTRFLAGRDLVFSTGRGPTGALISTNDARIAIGGPGQVQVIAGRNIDFGTSQGVVTRGNLNNPFLPEGGADLLVVAGASPHDKNGNALPINAKVMDDQVLKNFFAELLKSGEESSEPDEKNSGATKGYKRGEAAIAALFPTGTADEPLIYQGDISLFFSQLKTEQGGDIRMLAPGGGVNAGLASVTGFERKAADLGIMTVQGGDIQAYSSGDFLVNSSRVFTISGGDLLIWSNEGNIDAGKGAKTATATPPPQLRIDKNGNFVLDVSQSIAGSGIGALKEGSDAALIAPKGEVNAGDAGIRSAGNLLLAAQRVVGADNIQVGGVATGVPVESASLGGALAGVSGIGDASKATEEQTRALSSAAGDGSKAMAEARAALASFRPSFITVEILGFGPDGALHGSVQ